MFHLVGAGFRNWISRDRRSAPPGYGLPAPNPFLLALCFVAYLIWFWMDPHSFWISFVICSVLLRLSADQLNRTGGILNVKQTEAAIVALTKSMGEQMQPLPLTFVQSVARGSSDADDEDEGRLLVITVDINMYPSLAKLEARDARVIDFKSMPWLQRMICRLSKSACTKKLKDTIQADAQSFSNGLKNLDCHSHPKTFAAVHGLTNESTKNWVCKLKITTRLLCLMRFQLNEQNWLCQNVKEDYFAAVAGPHIKSLLKDASSFSNAILTDGDILDMLPLVEALLDSLCYIKESLSRPDPMHVNVADIFRKVVDAFEAKIKESKNDFDKSRESAIVSATYDLIVALEFFYRNRNVQPILASAESGYTVSICESWISKVKKDAERLFPCEEDLQYIFILNNVYFVWKKKGHGEGFLSDGILEGWFKSLIDEYIEMYVDKYWVPLVQYIKGDNLINPDSSYLVIFVEKFDSICERHMKWKVPQTELRDALRNKISNLLVGPYDKFLASLMKAILAAQNSESSEKKKKGLVAWARSIFKRTKRKVKLHIDVYSADELTKETNNLFEG